jgi:hypothetical protein
MASERPKPTPASERLIREEYRDEPCQPGYYVLDDGRVVSGRELVRPLVEIRKRRRRA